MHTIQSQIDALSQTVRQRSAAGEIDGLDELLAQRLELIKTLWNQSQGTIHEAQVQQYLSQLVSQDDVEIAQLETEKKRIRKLQQDYKKGHKAVGQYANIKKFR
ncbi:hypothetical protein [Motilimonas pumila]|uniref:Flagellar protein FliT n=1 Tax=Motilimonas pumila TaxID=2303987 RepID=A0A418YGL4_9GAMM|nr:hypothetical protein [Motilimonas pumila]RJG49001.1 hypothetical protein D1Z90_06425 [Motilimonas pumila]